MGYTANTSLFFSFYGKPFTPVVHQEIADLDQVTDIGKRRVIVVKFGSTCNKQNFLVLGEKGLAVKVFFVIPFLTDGFQENLVFIVIKDVCFVHCIRIELIDDRFKESNR